MYITNLCDAGFFLPFLFCDIFNVIWFSPTCRMFIQPQHASSKEDSNLPHRFMQGSHHRTSEVGKFRQERPLCGFKINWTTFVLLSCCCFQYIRIRSKCLKKRRIYIKLRRPAHRMFFQRGFAGFETAFILDEFHPSEKRSASHERS